MKIWTIRGTMAVLVVLAMAERAQGEEPSGLYGSVGGLFVLQQDGELTIGSSGISGANVEFDEGFGVAVALGYDIPALPINIEFEYTFRNAESESITFATAGGPLTFEADLGSHTFMAHGILNVQLGDSPIGLYAGVGVGFTLSTIDVASIAGFSASGEEDDITLAYQARAGMTLKISDGLVLFAGARWFDAFDPEFDGVELNNESINIEAGLRFYF